MNNMTNVFIMMGGIALFGAILTFLDWLGRRKQRKARDRARLTI